MDCEDFIVDELDVTMQRG